MTQYVKTDNGVVVKYPYRLRDLRIDMPNVSFPADFNHATLADYGIFPVTETQPPAFDPATQRIEEGTPVFNDPEWEQTWDTVPLTPEEIADRQRDALLASRVPLAVQRLLPFAPQIKEVKTVQDGRTRAAQNMPGTVPQAVIDHIGNLYFAVAQLCRMIPAMLEQDDVHPSNE